jgi:hypothetical protein
MMKLRGTYRTENTILQGVGHFLLETPLASSWLEVELRL